MFMYIKKICQSYLDSCLASSQLTIVTANANSRKFSSAQGFLPRVVITILLVLLLRQNCDDFSKFTNISSLQFVNHHTFTLQRFFDLWFTNSLSWEYFVLVKLTGIFKYFDWSKLKNKTKRLANVKAAVLYVYFTEWRHRLLSVLDQFLAVDIF